MVNGCTVGRRMARLRFGTSAPQVVNATTIAARQLTQVRILQYTHNHLIRLRLALIISFKLVVLHPNQAELICGLQNGTIRVWDLAENKCTREYIPEPGEVAIRSISIAPDATQVVAANNNGTGRSNIDNTQQNTYTPHRATHNTQCTINIQCTITIHNTIYNI